MKRARKLPIAGGVALFFLPLFLPCGADSVYAIDLSLHVSPDLVLPVGSSASLFSAGYGGTLNANLEFLNFLSPYAEAGFVIEPLLNAGSSVTLALAGGGLQAFTYPLPRLALRAGGGGGVSALSWGATSGMLGYWRAKAEAGYRFSPAFSLLADASYSNYFGSQESFFTGLSLGLTLHIGLGSMSDRESGVSLDVNDQSEIFPITYYKYDKTAIATIELKNHEQAEIRNVRVFFSAGDYTSRETECAQFAVIPPGKSVRVPLYGAFNERVLAFTEATKVQGEIRIDYKILDASAEAKKVLSLRFNGRNAMTWRDPAVAAAFVSPQDPAMLEISKYVAGLVRNRIRTDIDKNLQYGMGLFEALRLYGLVQGIDPTSPYKSLHATPDSIAYVQYPSQTLAYKSGDSDAIALTFSEALESVAVPSAIVPLADDVIVAFPLDMSAAEAKTSFIAPGDFIYDNNEAWVPLQASRIREGFLSAWLGGAKLWRDAVNAGGPKAALGLVRIEDAWKKYTPVNLPDSDFKPIKPAEDQINLAFENALGRFVSREITPRVQRLVSDMGGLENGNGRQLNSLGILYARYGLYPDAKAQFEKAVAKNYNPAIVNLANVAFLLGDYETAAAYFQKALDLQPTNKAALIGLARAKYELDAYSDADNLFSRVEAIDPALAERYSYLSSHVDASTALRASSAAADRGGGMTWVDEE